MAHIAVWYAPAQHDFAHQLATQLAQRGLAMAPPPDLKADDTAAQVVIVILPAPPAQIAAWNAQLAAFDDPPPTVAALLEPCDLPPWIKQKHAIDFSGAFLLAVEALVRRLHKLDAPTAPVPTDAPMMQPGPVARPALLPQRLPAERCWREDRLRINYELPILISEEELAARLPEFLARLGFRLEAASAAPQPPTGRISARRGQGSWRFDPRRAPQRITVRVRKGRLRVEYRLTRLQVRLWLPSHYRVLDREAAALYRYLATGALDDASQGDVSQRDVSHNAADLLQPVTRQARRARLLSGIMWGGCASLFALATVALTVWLLL